MRRRSGMAYLAVSILALLPGTAQASTVVYYMIANGDTTVSSGHPLTLDIYASFDVRLVAAQYSLYATGDAQLDLTGRLANPLSPCGLSFISLTSQDPYENGLPIHLNSALSKEVFLDLQYDMVPGGATDGIPPTGEDEWVLLDRITVVPSGTGTVSIQMLYPFAATTESNPSGELVESVLVAYPSVTFTVERGPGDFDGDGVIDLDDFTAFADCLAGPDADAGSACVDVFDMDSDGDVDLADFAVFQELFNG